MTSWRGEFMDQSVAHTHTLTRKCTPTDPCYSCRITKCNQRNITLTFKFDSSLVVVDLPPPRNLRTKCSWFHAVFRKILEYRVLPPPPTPPPLRGLVSLCGESWFSPYLPYERCICSGCRYVWPQQKLRCRRKSINIVSIFSGARSIRKDEDRPWCPWGNEKNSIHWQDVMQDHSHDQNCIIYQQTIHTRK